MVGNLSKPSSSTVETSDQLHGSFYSRVIAVSTFSPNARPITLSLSLPTSLSLSLTSYTLLPRHWNTIELTIV